MANALTPTAHGFEWSKQTKPVAVSVLSFRPVGLWDVFELQETKRNHYIYTWSLPLFAMAKEKHSVACLGWVGEANARGKRVHLIPHVRKESEGHFKKMAHGEPPELILLADRYEGRILIGVVVFHGKG
jgi:hypothetical protein